jgi:hypothetical protein
VDHEVVSKGSTPLPTPHSPLPTLLCLAAPLSILAIAYAWLAVNHGEPWLWDVTVHESGRYTLRETVFYFRHFLREIPVDLGMALFLIAGFMNSHEANQSLPNGKITRWAWLLLAAAAGLMVAAFIVAASQHSEQGQLGQLGRQGWTSAALDLLQFRTRDDLVEYGSHWRFHWLSSLWFGVAAMLGASFVARLCGRSRIEDRGSRIEKRESRSCGANKLRSSILDPRSSIFQFRIWLAPWAYFAALTIVFWFSRKTFTDVRYTGHQAREIMTHGPVTYLLGFGVLRLLASRLSASQSAVESVRV